MIVLSRSKFVVVADSVKPMLIFSMALTAIVMSFIYTVEGPLVIQLLSYMVVVLLLILLEVDKIRDEVEKWW